MDKMYANSNNWKKVFGSFLTAVFNCYSIRDTDFADSYGYHDSTIRYWKNGTSFPRNDGLEKLKEYILSNANNDIRDLPFAIDLHIQEILNKIGYADRYMQIKCGCDTCGVFICETLTLIYQMGKGSLHIRRRRPNQNASAKTQAIIFDFDGTLTSTGINKTIWEYIWTELGYDINECKALHLRFNRKEINHDQWCRITENRFREKHLHRATVEGVADNISLLDGVEDTFKKLQKLDIKIYIVSGSILSIIQKVLGNLFQYIDGVKANQFRFDSNGFLTKIIGTKYDFEGKSLYIRNLAKELNISPREILFVGNSTNDQYAHSSGAKTLCINPVLTDASNTDIWHECILNCENLTEILKYIDPQPGNYV